jgi:hypothetical protein
MSLEGAVISRGNIGPTKQGGDGISALIGHGVAVAGKIALLEIKTLYELADAVALGLDAAYDTTNNIRVYRHISEFYRKPANKGKKLYIMLVNNAVASGSLTVPLATIVEDTAGIYAKKLILEGNGEIKNLAFMFNPAATYVGTSLNGLDTDVYNSIAKAQGLYEWADSVFMPCQILLEGYAFNGLASAAQDLRAITSLKAHKVSVVIGQDWDYAETQNAIGKKMADIGAALGSVAYAKVSQNIGDCEDPILNLTDATKSKWLTAGLSSHDKVKDRTDLSTLDTKGYIFGYTVPGLDGVRWNGDHVCGPIELDSEGNRSEASISDGRTMDKARRGLRAVLLPKVRTTQRIDAETGKLTRGTIEYFNGLGDTVFEDMKSAGECSGGKTNTDPDSNLSVQPRILNVGFSLVTEGQIDAIAGKINLKTSL